MNKGTRFFNCDFQVHTPRDINWSGIHHISDEDREGYAESFVRECRTKGLDAIAITDHHDFTFVDYIRTAASNEVDDQGNLISPNDRLVVFPGLELTFAQPASCQAILLLDVDFPKSLFSLVLNTLGIVPSLPESPTTAEVAPISGTKVNGLTDLHDQFDVVDALKGRYIVLPNLSRGHGGVLRRGFYEHYKNMPCVGGYVDGALPSDAGWQTIINGKDRNYGFKSVAVIQTSDSRQEDFSGLGTHTSWIKWAEPTAEALRQAFLAKESRVDNEVPQIPNIYISKIDVTNSKYMGGFSLELNPQYNALIGGRGTGKTTILEYIRWGLCDFNASKSRDVYQTEVEKRRQLLIENTLVPYDGEVRISFVINGVIHVVKRNSVTNESIIKIGDAAFEKVNNEEVNRILPIQAYSQKQLSSVGVRTEELKRFIQTPIAPKLDEIYSKTQDLAKKLTIAYSDHLRKITIDQEIGQYNLESKSLSDQANDLRKNLSGINEDQLAVIVAKPKIDQEESIVDDVDHRSQSGIHI